MEEPVYVKVNSPLTLRKELLQTNIQILETLKRREEVFERHEEKNKIRKKLKTEISSLNRLIGRLQRELPKHKMKRKTTPPPKQPKIKMPKASKIKEVEMETPYSDQLEKELDLLKAKLSNL